VVKLSRTDTTLDLSQEGQSGDVIKEAGGDLIYDSVEAHGPIHMDDDLSLRLVTQLPSHFYLRGVRKTIFRFLRFDASDHV
jgi:hypothetical protein